MLNDIQTYCIHLEDYALPRHAAVSRCYYGTMDDMVKLAANLSKNDWARKRYHEMIEGIEYYDLDSEVSHLVAGAEYPVLSPVEVIFQNDFIFNDKSWYYTGYNHIAIPMHADQVNVSQILVQQEEMYHRCIKVKFKNILCYSPYTGWNCPNYEDNGFPYIVQETGDDTYTLQFYVAEQSYRLDQKDTALQDMNNLNLVNLSVASTDFMGYI